MKNKYVFLMMVLILFTINTNYGQIITPNPIHVTDKYCEITFNLNKTGVKGAINLMYTDKNDTEKPFQDSTVINALKKVTDYTTTVGLLNYMAKIDWTLINEIPIIEQSNTRGLVFYFKRSFVKIDSNH